MELARCDKYYDKVLEKFPGISRKQLDKIIKHGCCSLYLYNLYGGDVLLKIPGKYIMYFGKLFNDSLLFTKYALIKWKIKLRIKYWQNKTQFDGYYYFGLTDELFKEWHNSRLRNKGKHFERIKFYKILDECTHDRRYNHFFRMPYPEFCGFTMYKEDYIARNIEYIYRRKPDKSIEPVSYETKRNKCVKRRVK